jgi:hypothetical protein
MFATRVEVAEQASLETTGGEARVARVAEICPQNATYVALIMRSTPSIKY